MSTADELLKKKIEELERQNAALLSLRNQSSCLDQIDQILMESGGRRKRKNSPIPLMKLRKYVLTMNEEVFTVVYLHSILTILVITHNTKLVLSGDRHSEFWRSICGKERLLFSAAKC